jgi:DNA-binding CsgD family transcriptional regulator
LGQAFSCSYVGLIDRNLRTMEGRAIAVGIDQSGQREYFETWSKHDLLRLWTRTFRPGAIETDVEIVPRSIMLRSDYYNGFLKPHDMHTTLRITLAVGSGFRKIISMARPASLEYYGSPEVEQYRRLMPHLQRAALVAQSVENSRLALNAFSEVWEQSARGILLLDRSGRVLFANRALRVMARPEKGLRLSRERIEAVNDDDNAALQRLIAGATGQIDQLDAARGGVLRLASASGGPGLSVAVSAVGSQASWASVVPAAFVLVTDPGAQPLPPNEMIRELFGLTPAEMRVAMRLTSGDSPECAARALDVSITTVRWHLASLYRKTGTSRQAELVRRLLHVPTL